MAERPVWLEKYKRPGTVFKYNGRDWFLYSNTSVRVEGKKNPQPVQKCLGRVGERGLVVNVDVFADQMEIRSWEYGFSYALQSLLEDISEEELLTFLAQQSPESYLLEGRALPEAAAGPVDAGLEERIAAKVPLEKLATLKSIRLIDLGKVRVAGYVSEAQKALLDSLALQLPRSTVLGVD